jgi:hypothetical protein
MSRTQVIAKDLESQADVRGDREIPRVLLCL